MLDPMAGSGTVLAVARVNGHRAVGLDCDPLSVLLARTWTTAINGNHAKRKSQDVLQRAKKLFGETSYRCAYPSTDEETKQFIRFWFDDYARHQLYCLATCIRRTHDAKTRDILWAGFSRLIITKKNGASRAMDLSHSRPHRVFDRAPIKPFSSFVSAVNRVVDNCPKRNTKNVGPATELKIGDARSTPYKSQSMDFVLTSPPYFNAIDYMRCSKFSLVWMGYKISELRDIRSNSLGTEKAGSEICECEIVDSALAGMCNTKKVTSSKMSVLKRFVADLKSTIEESERVLKPNGKAIYVIGNNNLSGEFVKNSEAAKIIAKSLALRLESEQVRELPPNRRYLPPPSSNKSGNNMQNRMRTEVVLKFCKAG